MRKMTGSLMHGFGILALAAITITTTVAQAIPPGEIVLGNVVVFRLRNGSGKLDLEHRTGLLQERINEVLGFTDVTAKDVYIKNLPQGPTLFVRDIKLITVDSDTAKAAGTTQDSLAKQWAHRLMGVIAQVNVRLPGDPNIIPAKAPVSPAPVVVAGQPLVPLAPVPTTTPAPAPTVPNAPTRGADNPKGNRK
jgi:hypothetical protein